MYFRPCEKQPTMNHSDAAACVCSLLANLSCPVKEKKEKKKERT